MTSPEFLDIDPRILRLPPSRLAGADPGKLQSQIARHGRSTVGMPRIIVYRDGRGAAAMIDPVRNEVLQVLTELSEVVPEVRLGQLMANLSYLARGMTHEAIGEMEDEELLAVARQHLEQWRSRRAAPASR